MAPPNYEELDRDQLQLREEILSVGILRMRQKLMRAPHSPNGEWLKREIASLEAERDEVRELYSRKLRENVANAQVAMAGGDAAVAEYLRTH
jgi:hypothetical protein